MIVANVLKPLDLVLDDVLMDGLFFVSLTKSTGGRFIYTHAAEKRELICQVPMAITVFGCRNVCVLCR